MDYVGIALSIALFVSKGKEWADKIADFFGITSTNGHIAIYFVLGLAALGVVIAFFMKAFRKKAEPIPMAKITETKQENELNPTDIMNKITMGLKKMQVVVLPEEVQYTMQMSDKLNFEWDFIGIGSLLSWMGITSLVRWLYDLLLGKIYEAKITGTIEGRIDLTGVKAEVTQAKPPALGKVLEEIIVNVPIPAGYFVANFALMNINEIRNKAGLATDRYTIPQIQAAFAKGYPRMVREFIENKNMIANTKETIKKSIEGFVNGFMAALDFKDNPPFRKYEVKVTFTFDKWNIFEGPKGEKKIGEITEQSSEEQANRTEQTISEIIKPSSEEQIDQSKELLIKALTSN